MSLRLESLKPTLFLDGPSEYLVKNCAEQIALVPQFLELFGTSIDPYQREDYSIRELPALRIYNLNYTKEFESWFINGEIKIDVIWPAELRRKELEQAPDTVTSALLQQFRRPTFFETMAGLVPGLNELGKMFTVDKDLGFQWGDNVVPLTQVTVNFRLDLRQWDLYLERSGRTKEDPFEVTLGNLERIVAEVRGLKDSGEVDPKIKLDKRIRD